MAAATCGFYIEKGDLFAVVRPTRPRRVSFQLSKFSRIGAVGIYRPELSLLFLGGGVKEGDGFGVGRPGRVRLDPLSCGLQIDQRRGRITRRRLNVGPL